MAFNRIEQGFKLASDGAANGTSGAERIDHLRSVGVQIDGTFVATVTIEGRLSATAAFKPLTSVTDGIIYPLPNDMPLWQLRIVVSGYVSGTITATFVGRSAQA